MVCIPVSDVEKCVSNLRKAGVNPYVLDQESSANMVCISVSHVEKCVSNLHKAGVNPYVLDQESSANMVCIPVSQVGKCVSNLHKADVNPEYLIRSLPPICSTPPKPTPAPKPTSGPKSTTGAKITKGPNTGKNGARKTSGVSDNSIKSLKPLTKESQVRREILRGKLDLDCPSNAKVVRIFTSSTFTDSSHERNALMARVYPKLKSLCQEAGYEFQVVDMRWGVRDEATDNHMTTELCLREVKNCQRLSTGPNFVTFLSHKYGYRSFPSKIEAREFEKMFGKIEGSEDKELVNKWFKKDDNSVPSSYLFLPVSTHFPDFISSDTDKRSAAKQAWNEESIKVKEIVVNIAEKVLPPNDRNKYMISVTEAEIKAGILSADDVNNHCVWFKRLIPEIEDKEKSDLLTKYIDFSSSEREQTQKRVLLKELAQKKLPAVLGASQIHSHVVHWTEKGIDPEGNEDHKKYIDDLCEDFDKTITDMITTGIDERNKHAIADDLYEEVLQHTRFAQAKCRSFHGRDEMLETIKAYILGTSRSPLVVHGSSGSGKTSVMAKAAMSAKSWVDGGSKGVIILRFLGTTPDSTDITSLLTSIIKQVLALAKITNDIPTELKDIVELFHKTLSSLPPGSTLVLFLDSLDQLDPSHGARQLSWLPRHLPPHVKIVVSTLPEPIYECFPRLQVTVKDTKQFLEVPTLPDKDVSSILDSWLTLENRRLTTDQKTAVLDAFKHCPIPLFLKLSFDEACRWKSFERPEDAVLQTTVRAAINSLFDRVEMLHGKVFVSRALTLLTLSVSGLTESELEDILSCDEEVLNDVYQYWLPPVRRLPPLLLVRMKADLGEYLVDRGADGVRVFYWYHRQFIETATDRYCSDEQVNTKVHTLLADYFRGTWNGAAKSFTDSTGQDGEADRFVAAQPLSFGSNPNMRKLNNLPHHLICANMLSVLKQDVCLNMEFLLAKLKASSLRFVLDDFEEARQTFPDDEDINLVLEALRLSQDALLYDPKELPCQLLGRLPAEKEHIFGDVSNFPCQYVMPDVKILTAPGGQLIHCLAGHRQSISCVDISSDGCVAVTASADKSVRFWNVRDGKLLQAVENVVEDPERVHICGGDKIAVVNSEKYLLGLRMTSGDWAYKIDNLQGDNMMNFVVCGKDKSILVVFGETTVYLLDAITGKQRAQVTPNSPMGSDHFNAYDPISGNDLWYFHTIPILTTFLPRGRYVATAPSNSAILRVLDVVKEEFIHNKRMFPAPKTDDDDELTIDAVAISSDKKSIYVSNYMDNDIHICHLKTMAKLRVLKGKKSDNCEKFHVSLDGTTLYFPNYNTMCYVDLKTGQRTSHIKHPNSVTDVATVDLTNVVSISSDSVLRVWDLSREDPQAKPKVVSEAKEGRVKSARRRHNKEEDIKEETNDGDQHKEEKFTFRPSKFSSIHVYNKVMYDFRMIERLPNPRYIFVLNSRREMQIYDLVKKVYVRSAKVNDEPVKNVKWHVIDQKMAVVLTDDRQLQLIDLDRMEPIRMLQGYLPKYNSEIVVRKQAKEIITTTRGRKQLKIYNMDTGLTVKIMETNQTKPVEDLLMSKDGNWLAVTLDEGPLLIYNLAERQCRHVLKEAMVGEYPSLSDALFTPCSTFFLINCSRSYPHEADVDEYYYVVINIETGEIVNHLLDIEYLKKYKEKENDCSVDVQCSAYLRDFLLLTGSDDRLIRVWDVKLGKILHRLSGHSHDVSTLMAAENGGRFLSYSSYTEEEAFRLWDGHNFTCLATFKADDDMTRICLTLDGSRVVAGNAAKKALVIWQLMGSGTEAEDVTGEEEFEGEMTSLTFTPLGSVTFEEPDPDTEVAEVSDDEDNSTDDDDDLDKELEKMNFDDLDLDKELSDLNFSDSDDDTMDKTNTIPSATGKKN
ncbi:uncharacterized protein LOC135465527 [Liolophura sinensis]|uniref:uncharacterized protein LOC135465527 n=1 Tax=Liolophura sinensis TaxID=3198878 RepID=UPI0031590D3D